MQDQLEEGVKVVYVKLPNVAIELLHPLKTSSAVAKFLEKNPSGGIHHLCFAVRFNLKRLRPMSMRASAGHCHDCIDTKSLMSVSPLKELVFMKFIHIYVLKLLSKLPQSVSVKFQQT